MIKYRVKFSHMVQLPNSDQTNILIKVVHVDEVYEVESNVNIFTLIHSKFNVVGDITVETLSDDFIEENEK